MESAIKPGIHVGVLTMMRKNEQVNLRQSDGVDTLGVYFEVDHDRYDTGAATHTLRVLFVAGYPIVQYKSKTSRSAKWTKLKFNTGVESDDQKLEPEYIQKAWDDLDNLLKTHYFKTGAVIARGKPMIIQLQASDVETVKLGIDAPMIRYTAKSAYEKNFGKGV